MMKIGLLVLEKTKYRKGRKRSFDSEKYLGFRRIIQDVHKKYTPEFCWVSDIGKYDYVLCSLTSPFDYENLTYSFEKYRPKKNGCKLVVGGAGLSNAKLISEYIDIAVWGRAENQIIEILEGKELSNVWRKDIDSEFAQMYHVRQFNESYRHGEQEYVGCHNKCYFCEYTWRNKRNHKYSGHYEGGGYIVAGNEDDWRGLNITDGRYYVTAIDGFNEKTRFFVNKRIADSEIREKIESLYEKGIKDRISLKIYSIVGFPWETVETVSCDLGNIKKMLCQVDGKKTIMDLRIFFFVFPFSPTPLTPMQYMPANIGVNWRYELTKECSYILYEGRNIKAYIHYMIDSPLRLLRRMYTYRGRERDIESYKTILFSKNLEKVKPEKAIDFLLSKNIIPGYIYQEIDENQSSFEYLRTYADVKKLGRRLQRQLRDKENGKKSIAGRIREDAGS